jgi:hypothetical protein
MKKFNEWVEENIKNEAQAVNVMSPDQDEKELHILGSQIEMLLGKIEKIVQRTRNKNKGYELLGKIGNMVQTAMGVTDTNMKKAVLGQMPSQQR